jgi:hypothetical protein
MPPKVTAAREDFRTSRTAAVTAKNQFSGELSVFLNETAKPALLQTADHHEYAQMLAALIWGSRNCSNPFYVLEARGSDPDGVLRLFSDFFGYGDTFEQAKSNWGRTNP